MQPFAGLKCILCSESDCLTLDLDDLTTFRCRECEGEFTQGDVDAHIGTWQRVLAWTAATVAA